MRASIERGDLVESEGGETTQGRLRSGAQTREISLSLQTLNMLVDYIFAAWVVSLHGIGSDWPLRPFLVAHGGFL